MNEWHRIHLSLTLLRHNEVGKAESHLDRFEGLLEKGKFAEAERALMRFVQLYHVHPINRSRAYGILARLTAFMCLTAEEQIEQQHAEQI